MRNPRTVVLSVTILLLSCSAQGLAQIKSDAEAMKTFKVPEGFELRLFAGADICHNPAAIDVDIYGRVWVAEGMNYRSTFNKGPGPLDANADRIKVFEDTKGTGKADKVTVFCDKIPIVPMSICVAGDKAYVGVAPQLWVFDGASAKEPVGKNKTVLLDGFHKSGRKGPEWVDHDHTIHGLLLGPDGRMYLTVGDEGMKVKDNSGVVHAPNGGAVVRMNPDGTKMRVLADNLRNPYESYADSFGRVFCSDNDDDGNAQVRICYIIEGGDYGYRHNPKLPKSPTSHHWREDVPGVTPKILRTFAGSPCGIITYEGKLFPERFQGSLIHCDCGPQVVRAYHLKPVGAGFTCEIENLVTSTDKWFRPVDVAHAPDGSLYIADWYDAGVGGHAFREREIGRIYHLTMKGAPPPAKTPSPDLTTIPGLLSTLMSPMPSVRFLAIQKLRERGPEAATALSKLAREGKYPLERARALWVLFGMGDLGRESVLATLKDTDPRFRSMAVRMLREEADRNLEHFLPLAGDDNAEVRLEVAIALREIPTAKCKDALVKLTRAVDATDRWTSQPAPTKEKEPPATREDRWYPPTLAATLRIREPEFLKELFKDLKSPAEEAGALVIAWQINRPESVTFLSGVLKKPQAPEHFNVALNMLGSISDISAAEALAYVAFNDSDINHSRAALELLRRKSSSEWKQVTDSAKFTELFNKSQNDPATLSQLLALVGPAHAKTLGPKIIQLADSGETDKALRRSAIQALAQMQTPEAVARLNGILKAARLPDKPPAQVPATSEFAFAALAGLHSVGGAENHKSIEMLVLDRSYPTDLRREAVKLVGQTTDGCRFLLTAAEKEKLPVDIKGDAVQVTNRSPDKEVQKLAAKFLPLPKLAGNRSLPALKDLLAKNGDAAHGQSVFFKKESQCAKCHRVAGLGAWVGPDLSQIGSKLGKDGLLDSILNPSAAIAHEYVQFHVGTKKGQSFAGLIVEETPERLILKNAEGERIVIPTADVEAKSALPTSIMPEGLVQSMTDQELVDLLAYLSTLKQPSLTVQEWQVAGPFTADASPIAPDKGIDLKASYNGKGGAKVGWRKLIADREGRLDIEGSLGTREAAVYLSATVQSKAAQAGKVVILHPPDAKLTAWLNGKEVKVSTGATTGDLKALVPSAVEVALQEGKNQLVLRIVGSDNSTLVAVTTVVSPQGVELPSGGN